MDGNEKGKHSKNSENDFSLIEFPDVLNLKTDVENLRKDSLEKFLERDELVYVICKNIEMKYMVLLGNLEYKAYQLECNLLRLKRKVELIQQKKNRQEPIHLLEIEGILDTEYREYQKKMDDYIVRMNAALKRKNSPSLSEEDKSEFKRMYREIVKALHPDLHPNIGEHQLELFHHAVSAYKSGDINGLRSIHVMVVTDSNGSIEGENNFIRLNKEKKRLLAVLKNIDETIVEVKNNYPYTMKPVIESEEMVEMKKQEIEASIEALKEGLTYYQTRIDELLRG